MAVASKKEPAVGAPTKTPAKKAAPKKAEAGEAAAQGGKPERPDEKEYQARIQEKTDAINAVMEQVKAIQAKVQKALEGKEEFDAAKQVHYDKLQAFQESKAEFQKKKQELFVQKQTKKKADLDAAKALKTLTKELNSVFDEQKEDYPGHSIDCAIAKLERKMEVSSLSLKEEKDCMIQIKKLKAQKPCIELKLEELDQLKARHALGAQNPQEADGAAEGLDEVTKRLSELQAQMDAEYKLLNELKASRQVKLDAVKDKRDAKTALLGELESLKKERQTTRDELRQKQKTFNEWEKEIRKAKKAKEDAEWKKQKAEWDKEKLEAELNTPTSVFDKMVLVQQSIDYCQNLLPKEAREEEEPEVPEFSNAPEGALIMVNKKDREQEMYFAATKKKNLKKKGSEKKQAIKHTPETFGIFANLGVKAPMSPEDCASVMATLKDQLVVLEKEDAAEREKRKAKYDAALEEVRNQEAAEKSAVSALASE